MLPSTASLLVQFMPPPVTASAAPLDTDWLKIVNESPITSAGPTLVTMTVPVPILVSTPLTFTRPLDCVCVLSTAKSRLPLRVRLLLMVSTPRPAEPRSEEHTSELQSLRHLVCRLLLEKKK